MLGKPELKKDIPRLPSVSFQDGALVHEALLPPPTILKLFTMTVPIWGHVKHYMVSQYNTYFESKKSTPFLLVPLSFPICNMGITIPTCYIGLL